MGKVMNNYGTSSPWTTALNNDGSIKAHPFYVQDDDHDVAALSLSDVDALVEAREALLMAQAERLAEIAERLPTEPGLYVPTNYADKPWGARIFALHTLGDWTEVSAGDHRRHEPIDEAQMRVNRDRFGGLTRLRAVKED